MDSTVTEPEVIETPAPIAVRVLRYICPYCKRGRSTRKACALHMERCWKNPDLHGCKTCDLFKLPDRCAAGFNIKPGLVTNCKKWRKAPEPHAGMPRPRSK